VQLDALEGTLLRLELAGAVRGPAIGP
jgi:hypothetical protein